MLSKRLAICILLAKGYSYRKISDVLKVSLATIGTIATNYKYQADFHSIVLSVLEDEKIEDFWLKIGEAVTPIGTIGGKGSGAWIDVKNRIKKERLKKSF